MPSEPLEFELFFPEGRGILGSMDGFGEVTFAIHAGEGSSIRGTEMFNRMLDAFGKAVKSIRGVWIKRTTGEASTNIDKVNELVASGMALEEAVLHAWTFIEPRRGALARYLSMKHRRTRPAFTLALSCSFKRVDDGTATDNPGSEPDSRAS